MQLRVRILDLALSCIFTVIITILRKNSCCEPQSSRFPVPGTSVEGIWPSTWTKWPCFCGGLPLRCLCDRLSRVEFNMLINEPFEFK